MFVYQRVHQMNSQPKIGSLRKTFGRYQKHIWVPSYCYKVRPASYKLVYNPHEYYSYIMSYSPSQREFVNLKLLDIGAST